MRTMSWSRYHTFTRIPTHLRSRAVKRLRRAAKTATKAATQASVTQGSVTQRSVGQGPAARPEPARQGDLAGDFWPGFPNP